MHSDFKFMYKINKQQPKRKRKIVICFTSGDNEQLTIACFPRVEHAIFPNTSSDNYTFTLFYFYYSLHYKNPTIWKFHPLYWISRFEFRISISNSDLAAPESWVMFFPCYTRCFFYWGVKKWICSPGRGQ